MLDNRTERIANKKEDNLRDLMHQAQQEVLSRVYHQGGFTFLRLPATKAFQKEILL